MVKSVKSPLRYPGGKSRVVDYILPYVPLDVSEFREPFVGGGSVFIAVKSIFHKRISKYWLNDLNLDLYLFWKYTRDEINNLVTAITKLRQFHQDGRELYKYLNDKNNICSEFDKAVRFFIMNRITFSGVMDSGGYSQQAFEKRFTESCIEKLANVSSYLSDVHISCGDYEELLIQGGNKVFLFLDPPYYQATKSKLYGVKGNLHTNFDHERFAHTVKRCEHRWLITYDDCPEIRKLFSFADITELEVQYGMNNYKQKNAAKGKELLIKNYSSPLLKRKDNKADQLALKDVQKIHHIPDDLFYTIKNQDITVEDSWW
ncbi:DNA adenine methylase [Iningainema tapete]|uniref:site-specific DNA-methyltransferase (adenine-specific) n=1 Tax=Iningainema tapete BLCC-T55 TaxID=2748662 RepID=A0A8J6XHU5_9CYAN|nr:DNA adenine methylase [Iningainema tapete]MBD2776214.1 DNA adenine methylase [Iningainema tapete BLCC-T55]